MKRIRLTVAVLLVACTAIAGLGGVAAADSADAVLQVVASQLRNPRHMTVAADGTLYVAEAGNGGTRCVTVGEGDQQFENCGGRTGAITRVRNGVQRRVITGLSSIAGRDGSFAGGPHDVEVSRNGRFTVLMGGGGGVSDRREVMAALGDHFRTGGTMLVGKPGSLTIARDLIRYETRHNPDGLGPQAGDHINGNPFGLAKDGRNTLVVDAGANTLYRMRPGRPIQVVTTFRGIKATFQGRTMRSQSVPTAVAVGPDGAYYVSELSGFPAGKGDARVWRVTRSGAKRVHAKGFTNIIDLAFDRSGRMLVLEMVKDGFESLEAGGPPIGRLVRVNSDGSKTTLASKGLIAPTGLAVARNGDIYIANNGISPGDGTVVKLRR